MKKNARAIEHAIVTAVGIHDGQRDKSGGPYLLHIMRVAGMVSECTSNDPVATIVSILHDCCEDGGDFGEFCALSSIELLEKKHQKKAKEALYAITKQKNEDYESYIQRVKKNKVASFVKTCDLLDNTLVWRNGRTKAMETRYRKALEELSS